MFYVKLFVIFLIVSCGDDKNQNSNLNNAKSSSFIVVPTHSVISKHCGNDISTSYGTKGLAISAMAACVAKLPDFGATDTCATFPEPCIHVSEIPLPPGSKVPNKYKEIDEANKDAGCKGKNLESFNSPEGKNKLISDAYARMYLSNPDTFKWSGLAAFASDTVGFGLTATDKMLTGNDKIDANVIKDTHAFLAKGNSAVFNDLHWQQQVYKDRKLEGLKFYADSGALTPDLYEAWNKIDQGVNSKNPEKVWEGNNILLKYEQEITLQPLYDQYKNSLNIISNFAYSPVPGSFSPFKMTSPTGNIAAFADRWKWIATKIVPEWKTLESKGSDKVAKTFQEIINNKKEMCK